MKAKNFLIGGILPSALMLLTIAPAQSVTLINDNFNTENGGIGSINYSNTNSGIFTNWVGGKMGLYGNGVNNVPAESGLYLAFPTSPDNGGVLVSKSVIPIKAGETLTLSFRAATSAGALGIAQIGDVLGTNIFNYSIPFAANNNSFQQFSTTFNITPAIAQATTTPQLLYFQSVNPTNSNARFFLDDIVLTSNPTVVTTVPEPSTIPGLLFFCAGLFGLRKLFKSGW
jgi:hypothetical protein